MEEEDRKKLKDFDDVLKLLSDMIRNIDDLMETLDQPQSLPLAHDTEKSEDEVTPPRS